MATGVKSLAKRVITSLVSNLRVVYKSNEYRSNLGFA